MSVRPLVQNEMELLHWSSNFKYDNMVRIRTPMDGSCFFHSIAKGTYIPYRQGTVNKSEFIKDLRKELAAKLASPVNLEDAYSPIYYDIISRGTLREMATSMPEVSLEHMQQELISNKPVSNIYNEFISNIIDIDIYILDLEKEEVVITGNDDDILYSNRPSIVLGYIPESKQFVGHYELIGIKSDNMIKTKFTPTSHFIQAIKDRKSQLLTK